MFPHAFVRIYLFLKRDIRKKILIIKNTNRLFCACPVPPKNGLSADVTCRLLVRPPLCACAEPVFTDSPLCLVLSAEPSLDRVCRLQHVALAPMARDVLYASDVTRAVESGRLVNTNKNGISFCHYARVSCCLERDLLNASDVTRTVTSLIVSFVLHKVGVVNLVTLKCFARLVTVGGHFRIIQKWRTSSIFVFCPFSREKN